MIDVRAQIAAVTRSLSDEAAAGETVRVQRLVQTYPAPLSEA